MLLPAYYAECSPPQGCPPLPQAPVHSLWSTLAHQADITLHRGPQSEADMV